MAVRQPHLPEGVPVHHTVAILCHVRAQAEGVYQCIGVPIQEFNAQQRDITAQFLIPWPPESGNTFFYSTSTLIDCTHNYTVLKLNEPTGNVLLIRGTQYVVLKCS